MLPATEQLAGANCVGGLEVNINFSNAEDRTAILQAGNKLGWTPAVKTDSLTVHQNKLTVTNSLLEIHVEGSLLPFELVAMSTKTKERYKHCYLRYKFYDRGEYCVELVLVLITLCCYLAPVVSKPYPITSLKGNKAFYKIFHSSRAELTNTETLKWFVVVVRCLLKCLHLKA